MRRRAARILFLSLLLSFHPGWMTPGYAQNVEGQVIASEFGEYQVWGSGTNRFTFTPTSCQVSGGGRNFAAFARGVPVMIVDPGNPAIDETLVAGLVDIQSCSVQLSPLNKHSPPFYLTSGTGGLQEAIDANLSSQGANTIILSAEWYRLGGSTATIASVRGTSSLRLEDITTTPATWYQWSGTAYIAVRGSGGVGSVNGIVGPVTITPAGSNVTVTPQGNNIRIGVTGVAGVSSINGDTSATQTIVGAGGISCSTASGTTTCNYAGTAGSGAVGSGGPYNDSGYTPNITGTTVGPETASLTAPMNLTSSQLSSVLSQNHIRLHLQAGDAHTPFVNSTNHDPVIDDRNDVPALTWNAKASGAQCDAGAVQGTFALNSQTLTRAGSASDVGKIIMAVAPDAGGVPTSFISTVTSLDGSNNDVMASKSPFTTAANWVFALGHDDSASLADWLTYGYGSSIVTLALPGGTCLSSKTLNFDGQNIWGHGTNQSEIVGPPGLDTLAAHDPSIGSGRTFSPGQHLKDFTIAVDAELDATQAWTSCVDAVSGTTPVCTSQSPLYRPIGIGGVNANYPLNRGWITGTGIYNTGAINGVANTTSSSAVICVPSSTGQAIPIPGQQIIFPYQGLGSAPFSTTVASLLGSCGTGFSPLTLTAPWPGSTLTGPQYVAAQEWFAGTSIQTTATAIPAASAQSCSITSYVSSGTSFTGTCSNGFSGTPLLTLSGFTAGGSTALNGLQVTVASVTGTTFTGTLSSSFTNTATATGNASIFPFKLSLANDITPDPQFSQANVGAYGLVELADTGEICSYFGTSNVPASQSLTANWIKLTACAQNGTTAASHASGTQVFPLNPLNPALAWAVIPSLNTNTMPTNAEPYPSNGVGNAGISLPTANGVGANGNEAPGQALWENFQVVSWPPATNSAQSPVSFQEMNDTACIYMVAIPFKSTFKHWQCQNSYYGLAQGMPSINFYDQGAGGFPTGDGNTWDDYQIHAAYDEWRINEGSSSISNGQNFSNANAPPNNTWPGYPIARAGGGGLGHMYFDGYYTDRSTSGGGVACCTSRPGLGQVHIDTQYVEVEAPTLPIYQLWARVPARQLNCNNCVYTNWEPKDGGDPAPTYVGGAHQTFLGGNSSGTPWINFGFHNIYQNIAGLGSGATSYVYGSGSFLNWGPGTQMTSSASSASPFLPNLVGNSRQSCSGQTQEMFFGGNTSNPYTCAGVGYITPEEFNTSAALDASPMSQGWVLDPTEPVSGSYAGCNVTTSGGCSTFEWESGNPINIGPGQRITAGKYLMYTDFKTSTSGTGLTFNFAVAARANGTCTTSTVYSGSQSVNSSGWTQVGPILVDFSGKTGCNLNVAYTNASSNLSLQTGFIDFMPLPQNITAASFTTTGSGASATIFSGAGAPTGCGTTYSNGSLYLNTAGTAGSMLYTCIGTTWTDIK